MANFSKFLSLINGADRTVDLSNNSNILELGGGGLQMNGSTSGHVVISASATTATYSLVLPSAQAASPGYVLSNDGTGVLSWVAASGGSVSSVALDLPLSVFTVSGSPVTSSGTLTGSLNTQVANSVWAGPASGPDAAPTFRSLVSADIPSLSAIYLPLAGGTMSGAINMGGNNINNMAAGTSTGQALVWDQIGAANGIAALDGSGKVPYAQLPSALMTYKGAWDPTDSVNTLTFLDASPLNGDVFRASVDGVAVVGNGAVTGTQFYAGDFAIYNGTAWQRSPLADGVVSVNGATGAVTVNAINQLTGDVTSSTASGSQSEATTVAKIQGNTVSGTTGTGNVVFSASPTLTGTISAASANLSGSISASNFSGSSSGTNTGDQTITLTGDVTGSGTGSFAATISSNAVTTSKINNAAVTAAKLGAVTDGITTDQNGSGSTIEVLSAPAVKESLVAGESFAATTLWAVRFAKAADAGFVAGRMYKADNDTTSADNFYVVGLAFPAGSVSAAGAIMVTKMGLINVPSHGFTPGVPLYLGASGAVTATAPSASLSAVERVGIVRDANNIEVQISEIGIN